MKAAPVSRALARSGLAEYLVHTGQHYDRAMSEVFFEELDIRQPDLNLHVGSGSHAVQTAAMLTGLEASMIDRKPDWVLIYGDTNSTLAAAVVAAKLHIPVAHVEAGLRSFNRRMPEEINRIVADSISTLLFAPTETARKHLLREGVSGEQIVLTGDVMFDAMLLFGRRASEISTIHTRLGLAGQSYVLATIHRAENTDNPQRLAVISEALAQVAEVLPVVLPLHPRTKARLAEGGLAVNHRVKIIEPVGFLDMLRLEMDAAIIATDSGGVQKEAFFHQIPCVTLRNETEWVELVDSGWNRLVPLDSAEAVARAILAARGTRGMEVSPFGDGRAAENIANRLLRAK